MRRLVAAAESEAIGYGGVSAVARATGVSRRAITEGIKELGQRKSARQIPPAPSRIRRKGGGRKRSTDKDPGLLEDLDRLVDPATRGDPESALRWTCKSVRRLAEELQRKVMPSATKRWPSCCRRWTIVCRPIRRPWKEASMRIGIGSLSTSTERRNGI